jgi:hypothetical protein
MATLKQLIDQGYFTQVRFDTFIPNPEWVVTATNEFGIRLPIASIAIDQPYKKMERVTFGHEQSGDMKVFPVNFDYPPTFEFYRRMEVHMSSWRQPK